jgi:hypothetical protein
MINDETKKVILEIAQMLSKKADEAESKGRGRGEQMIKSTGYLDAISDISEEIHKIIAKY